MEYLIRKFKLKDMPEVVKTLGDEWNLGKRQSRAKGNICAWIYMFYIVGDANELLTYTKDNKLIGFAGYTSYAAKPSLKQKLFSFLAKIMFYHPFIKDRKALVKYYNLYEYIPEKMKTKTTCSLTILIANKKSRGIGVGSKLFDTVCMRAKSNGKKKMIIETDDSCNVDFYMNKGCVEIKRFELKSNEQGRDKFSEYAYLLEKRL